MKALVQHIKQLLRRLFGVILYLWQLPQNVLGLLMWFVYSRGTHEITENGYHVIIDNRFRGGISLGQYIILGTRDEISMRHETGHCIQSKLLGWLYLIVIGLPSLIHAALHKEGNYYDFYTERWADKLAGVKR